MKHDPNLFRAALTPRVWAGVFNDPNFHKALRLTVALFAVVVLAILVASCDDQTPPQWVDVCVRSHPEHYTAMVPKIAAPGHVSVGGMVMVRRTRQVCDEYTRECQWGRDYSGPTECAP